MPLVQFLVVIISLQATITSGQGYLGHGQNFDLPSTNISLINSTRDCDGVTHTRWGQAACSPHTIIVYAGITGATYADDSGGAANYLCMPYEVEYSLPHRSGTQGYSHVYGVEYEGPPLVPNREQHNAPCAVCCIPEMKNVVMIPAKMECPSGWTRQYHGYLMSEHIRHYRTEYVCVDSAMQSITGSQDHIDGGHFWHVEAHCNGMACPPYNNYKELTCVVCSK